MGRERSEFFRDSNTKEREKAFILAFEGNETEEQYFDSFKKLDRYNRELVYLHSLKRDKDDTRSAPNHVYKKLKKEAKDEYNFRNSDELWMIIDRDRWQNIPEIVNLCKKDKNMYVALSNPCFEFWLLLHVKDINEYNSDELINIYENKKVNKKKTYVEKQLETITGSYRKSNIKAERFLLNLDKAIAQAKELDNNNEEYPTQLGSHIYKLIENIINYR